MRESAGCFEKHTIRQWKRVLIHCPFVYLFFCTADPAGLSSICVSYCGTVSCLTAVPPASPCLSKQSVSLEAGLFTHESDHVFGSYTMVVGSISALI